MDEILQSLKNIHQIIIGICTLILLVTLETDEGKELNYVLSEIKVLNLAINDAQNSDEIYKYIGEENVLLTKEKFSILIKNFKYDLANIKNHDSLKISLADIEFKFPQFENPKTISSIYQNVLDKSEINVVIPNLPALNDKLSSIIKSNDDFVILKMDFRKRKKILDKFEVKEDSFLFKIEIGLKAYENIPKNKIESIRQQRLKSKDNQINTIDNSPLFSILRRNSIEGSIPVWNVELKTLLDSIETKKFNLQSWLLQEKYSKNYPDSLISPYFTLKNINYDPLVPESINPKEYEFFSNIKKHMYLIADETLTSSQITAEQKLQENKKTITLLGFSINYEGAIVAFPILIFVLMLYFKSNLLHLTRYSKINTEEINIFPWIALFNDPWSKVLWIVSIIFLPLFANGLLFYRYWRDTGGWLIISFALLVTFLIYALSRSIHELLLNATKENYKMKKNYLFKKFWILIIPYCLCASGCKKDCSNIELTVRPIPAPIQSQDAKKLLQGINLFELYFGALYIGSNLNDNIRHPIGVGMDGSLLDLEEAIQDNKKGLELIQKLKPLLDDFEILKTQLKYYANSPNNLKWDTVWTKAVVVYRGFEFHLKDPIWSKSPLVYQQDFSRCLSELKQSLQSIKCGIPNIVFSKSIPYQKGTFSKSLLFEPILKEIKVKSTDELINACKEEIKQDSLNQVKHFCRIGTIFILNSQIDSARYYLTLAINIDSTDAKLFLLRSFTSFSTDIEFKDINRCINLGGIFFEAYYKKAKIFEKIGNLEEAEISLTNAIKISPDNPGLYFERGEIRMDRNDNKNALLDYEKAIQLCGNDSRFVTEKQFSLVKKGMIEGVDEINSTLNEFENYKFNPNNCSIESSNNLPPVLDEFKKFCSEIDALYLETKRIFEITKNNESAFRFGTPSWNLMTHAYFQSLPKWTKIWEKMGAYYYDYKPNSGFESFLITAPMQKAALLEAEVVSEYFYLTWGVDEYKTVKNECARLYKNFENLEKATFAKYAIANIPNKGNLKQNPLNIGTNQSHDVISAGDMYHSLFNELQKKTSHFMTGNAPDKKGLENWEKIVRPLVMELIKKRIILGYSADPIMKKKSGCDSARVNASMHTVAICGVYYKYRLDNGNEWTKLGLDCLKLVKTYANAEVKALTIQQEIHKSRSGH